MNCRLRKIFEEDQRDRRKNIDWNNRKAVANLIQQDTKRRTKVEKLLRCGEVTSAVDYYHAAIIFHHALESDYHLKAHQLAKKAVRLGYPYRWIVAATWDRYCLRSGSKFQKYGTQFFWDEKNRKTRLYPIDPSTTDNERKNFNVPPLAQILKRGFDY